MNQWGRHRLKATALVRFLLSLYSTNQLFHSALFTLPLWECVGLALFFGLVFSGNRAVLALAIVPYRPDSIVSVEEPKRFAGR
jgi:hypothetical protein